MLSDTFDKEVKLFFFLCVLKLCLNWNNRFFLFNFHKEEQGERCLRLEETSEIQASFFKWLEQFS